MKNSFPFQYSSSRAVLLALAVAATAGFAGLVKAGETPQNLFGIAYPVIQGYRVGEVQVIGARVIPLAAILTSVGMVSGEVYDESKLRKGLEDVKKSYGVIGFVTVRIEPVLALDEQRRLVNLTVNTDEGVQYRLRSISFTGNTTVPDAVLRREIGLTEGFIFNAKSLEDSLPRLNQLGLFEEITIQDFIVTPHPDEAKLDVVLRVREKRR